MRVRLYTFIADLFSALEQWASARRLKAIEREWFKTHGSVQGPDKTFAGRMGYFRQFRSLYPPAASPREQALMENLHPMERSTNAS